MALVLSFALVVIVLIAGFKDAAAHKHPTGMRILYIAIALAIAAAGWYTIHTAPWKNLDSLTVSRASLPQAISFTK